MSAELVSEDVAPEPLVPPSKPALKRKKFLYNFFIFKLSTDKY